MAGFKIVLTEVNSLAASLGAPIKFQQIGIWTRDYQDPMDLYESDYHPPVTPVPGTAGIMEATEGMELAYDLISKARGESAFCGGWVLHRDYGYVLVTLARDFPLAQPYGEPQQPQAGDVWEWNIATGTLQLRGAEVKGTIVAITYWNPSTGQWQSAPPTVYAHQKLGLSAAFGNPGSLRQSMRLDATFVAPDGTRGSVMGQLFTLDPGLTTYQEFYNAPPLQVGTYTMELILFAEVA
jgi:hypothetical protein